MIYVYIKTQQEKYGRGHHHVVTRNDHFQQFALPVTHAQYPNYLISSFPTRERRKPLENDAMVSRQRVDTVAIINANYIGLLKGLPHNYIERA